MAEVKWIKLKVGMFDGMSFKKIKKAKIGGESFRDKLTAVWFELMDFAGKCNHDGAFIDSREIPFKELSDIATMIEREEEELKLCMSFYINEGMISIIDDVYMLSTWSEYQNTDRLAELREYNRLAKQKQRAKKLLPPVENECQGQVKDKSLTSQRCQDTDIDIDIEIEEEKENNNILSDSPSSKPKKPVKHKYGEYNNVLLTDAELEKLKAEYPDYEERIERLSSYVASTGKSYKSHYATIRNWARKDQPKQQQQQEAPEFLKKWSV